MYYLNGGTRIMDLIIRQAHLRSQPGTWDIGINGDRIAITAEHIEEAGTQEVDAAGNLVARAKPHTMPSTTLHFQFERPFQKL